MKKITNTEQAGIEASFLAENVARTSCSSRYSGRTDRKSCGFRVRFFRSEITNIPPASLQRASAGRPRHARRRAAPLPPGRRRRAGARRTGPENMPGACPRARRRTSPRTGESAAVRASERKRRGGREHAERGPGQHRRLCRPQRSCVSAPYPVSPFLARSAA